MSTTHDFLTPPAPTAPRPVAMRPREHALLSAPVLLATDGSDAAEAATRVTGALVRVRGAKAQVLRVVPPLLAPVGTGAVSVADLAGDDSAGELRAQVDACVGHETGWPVHVSAGTPTTVIAREARARSAGLIVMGLRRHAMLDRVFRDETTLLVMRRAGVPVLGVTPLLRDLPRRVVVAVDFSRASLHAARAACSVVAEGGTLLLVHVQPEIGFAPEEAEGHGVIYAQGVVGAFARLVRELEVPTGVRVETVVLQGEPSAELLSFAERADAELIAVGSQRHTTAHSLVLGSVTTTLVRDGRYSLLVTPPASPDRPHLDGAFVR
jgi:nucleotide-binding universal stress UspA family protein